MPFVMLTTLPVDAAMTPSQALAVFALRVVGAGFVLWLLSVAIELVRGICGSEPSARDGSASIADAASVGQPIAAAFAPQAFAAPAYAPQAPQSIDAHTLAAIAVALELEPVRATARAGAPAHDPLVPTAGLSPWALAGRARQMRKR